MVQGQALRTALARSAPAEGSRPLTILLITAASLLLLVRDWRHALGWAVLASASFAVAVVLVLRGGIFMAPSAILFALWIAAVFRCVSAWRDRRTVPSRASNFQHGA